jgi:CheY-like chemotaxis protein
MAVTVLLVDDVPELRGVLRQCLRLRGGFEVVDDVGDGASAGAAAARHQPDVIVVDLGLPDLAGHEVLTRLRAVAHVEVRDRGSGGPEVQAADEGAEHGRGLMLVSALTEAWGVEPRAAGGKAVWAELRSGSEPVTDDTREDRRFGRRPADAGPAPFDPAAARSGSCLAFRRRPARADRVAVARRALPADSRGGVRRAPGAGRGSGRR